MPRKKEPPTFEELRVQRQNEWAEKQALARQQIGALHAQLAAMPDVAAPPSPNIPWSHEAISCPWCAVKNFYVTRWYTVNGARYRTELKCLGCERLVTWDWPSMAWIA